MIFRGSFGPITTNVDTPLPSAGRVGVKQQAYITKLILNVIVAGLTSTVKLQKGLNGDTVGMASTLAVGNVIMFDFDKGHPAEPGMAMGPGVTPSLKSEGGTPATFSGYYEIQMLGQGS